MKHAVALHWICVVLTVGLTGLQAATERVAISEIMYHPVEEAAFNTDGTPLMELYEDVHEFIELHNFSASRVFLAGWKFSSGVSFTFQAGASIEPGDYVVVAKNPERLRAIKEYELTHSKVFGPWKGTLNNRGETIRLKDASDHTVDSVSYSSEFPWPIGADAFGADEEWTAINPMEHQYRGRSLERVSFASPGDDPSNWLASPLPGEPSPGRRNALQRDAPRPVVTMLHVAQASDGHRLIRANQPARIDCLFSGTNELSGVQIDYFLDDIQRTNKLVVRRPMLVAGRAAEGRFSVELPGQTNRSVVRYRILADRGAGDEVVSPRPDDPYGWHAYFVSPVRDPVVPSFDIFISSNSLTVLRTNITSDPRRYTRPDPPGRPRKSWNATQPAIFIHDGVVYDIQMRYHGSQFRREVGRKSYKVFFPDYRRFNGRDSFFITDKDYQTEAGHAIFRAVGVPTSLTRWVDLYMNNTTRLRRLEQEEYNLQLLERFHEEQATLRPDQPMELPGEIFKSAGIFDANGGPYGPGNGRPLPARVASTNKSLVFWTPLQRYEWTYALQNHGWRGHTAFKAMIDGLWAARNARSSAPTTNEIPQLRDYFAKNWDVDQTLTYLATINWMVPWDDVNHNYFVWQRRNGLWSMAPWDFDSVMNSQAASGSIFAGQPNATPVNTFKESFIAAYREEFKDRIWWLNNTVFHPDNLAALGVSNNIRTWAVGRLRSVNTQSGRGAFERPTKPVNQSPASGQNIGPFARLEASAYGYSTNPVAAHASTTWLIRSASGSYYSPVMRLTTTNDLTTLAVPFERLTLGESYFWKCSFTDANGHPSLFSLETPFRFGADAPGADDIVMNEIFAGPSSSPANNAPAFDFIELHNPSSQAQSLDGFSLTDDLLQPARFPFPPGTVIPAHGYLVVRCDTLTAEPGLYAGFSLKQSGETIGLFLNSTNGYVLRDVSTFGPQLPNHSIGRNPDSAGAWMLNIPTPGRPNEPLAVGSPTRLKINEWMASPAKGEDWIELFNADPQAVNMGGLMLTDDLEKSAKSPITPLSFIAGGGFAVFTADGNPGKGADHLAFQLSSEGSAIGLYSAKGGLIDSVMFGAQTTDVSAGRVPDGAEAVYAFPMLSTPGKSNTIDANADGLPDAWELANAITPANRETATLDADADGFTNFQEFQIGTDPHDAQSNLQVEITLDSDGEAGSVTLRFAAAAGHSYTVQSRDAFADSMWRKLVDVPALPTSRVAEITQPSAANGTSYYRVVTPQLP